MEKKGARAGYKRVAEDLRQKIEAGTYPVGELMPSYDAIAVEYDVSKNVARDAIAALRDAGIVDVAPGIGTTVLSKPSELPASERDQLMQQIARMQERIEQVAADVVELRREMHGDRQPPARARPADRRASPTRS